MRIMDEYDIESILDMYEDDYVKVADIKMSNKIPLLDRDNFNTPDLEQSPDSFLRPGETLEDFDVEFRRPNAQGGVQQLVQPSADGSRPGYNGQDAYSINRKKKRAEAKEKGLVYDVKTKRFRKSKIQPSKYGIPARVDGKKSPEYDREYYKANKVYSEQYKKRVEQDNKLKNFIGKKKKIKASVLKDFVLNEVGYKFYNADQIKNKFPNLIIEKDFSTGEGFKPLTKQQKTLIKENFNLPEGVEKWNFKKHKYGISSDKYNILSNQIINKLEKRKYKVAGNFSTPEGWMMNAMYRLYDKELEANVKNLTYEPKFNKRGVIVGFTDNTAAGEGKTYYATEKAANDFGDGTEWRGHGDFDRVSKFIKIADGVKAKPDEVLNKLLDEKGINQLIKGKRALSLNDVLSHQRYYSTLAQTSPKELIKRQIVLHHTKQVGGDLAVAAATKDLQLLSGAVNAEVTRLENIVKGSSKEPGRKLTNVEKLQLKKMGAKITDFDGKIVGGGYTDPTKQFASIKKEALEYAKSDKFNVKTVASYLERLGCGQAAGGRILFAEGVPSLTKCAQKGVTKLENGLKNGFKNADDAVLARGILKTGRFLKDAVSLRGLFGPLALGFTVAAEAGLVGYDMLSSGKSFREAVGDSVFNYALGDKTKIDSEKEIIKRLQNIKTGPSELRDFSDEEIGKMQYFKENLKDMGRGFDLYKKLEDVDQNILDNIASQDGTQMFPDQSFQLDAQRDKLMADIQDYNRTGTPQRVTNYLLSPEAAEGADALAKGQFLVEQDRLQDAGTGKLYQSPKGDKKRLDRLSELKYELEKMYNPTKINEFGKMFMRASPGEQSYFMGRTDFMEGGIASLNVNKK